MPATAVQSFKLVALNLWKLIIHVQTFLEEKERQLDR